MPTLLWDQVGERRYEGGVDRGVLYLPDGSAFVWNGLTSVVEKPGLIDGTPVYFDGVKFGDLISTGDFSATIKAYTYPDEFIPYEGLGYAGNGLFLGNQVRNRFALSYRTRVGSDENNDLGYKIHVVYNLIATPAAKNFKTLVDNTAVEFEWGVTTTPENIQGFLPTAHVIFDTRLMAPQLIIDIETTLYGDGISSARLPTISNLISYIGDWVILRITDNLDGTWTADGPPEILSMLDSTTFQIITDSAVYIDGVTYVISDLTY